MRRRTLMGALMAALALGALLVGVSANAVQTNTYSGHIAPGTADTAVVRGERAAYVGTFRNFVAWTGDGTAFYIRRLYGGTFESTAMEIPGSCNLPLPNGAKDASGWWFKGVFIEGHTDTVYFEATP